MENHHFLFGTFLIIDHLPLSISLVKLVEFCSSHPQGGIPKQHSQKRPTQQGTQAISCQRIVFKGYINQLHVQTIIAPTWGWLWMDMDGYRNPVRLCGEIKLAILVIKTGHSWYQNYTILIPSNSSIRAAKKKTYSMSRLTILTINTILSIQIIQEVLIEYVQRQWKPLTFLTPQNPPSSSQ